MPRLLIVHHTPSPAMQEIFESTLAGATNKDLDQVEVVRKAALEATASDVLAADAYLLGTPANIGYMSGALKHFFDTIYYPCLDSTTGRPYGLYVHGNQGLEGAVNSVQAITKALGWKPAAKTLKLTGPPTKPTREAAWNLGATLAASTY
ncbi:flavodoxin family protein [Umezawaea endophytica]|uniref:NAD(P)H-dependent oxidoreductase n=1 Tax=Umezawaea endophytica TaxID=1654476 RepID=A0A9X3AJP1_9PSEU|nr:NAD(P)H-dependent oxidoreductase [Umezawaea endophytica]MCS7484306.1 NAD(P)H-dependent oxidoreductase [Umezawaea endophytica]